MITIFATVLFMGLTCSVGCGSVSTPFLLGSLLGDGADIRQSKKAIIFFSVGKIISLMAMGLLSAIFGSIILSYIEQLYPNVTIWIIRIATFLFGGKILYSTLKNQFFNKKTEETTSACGGGCAGCKSRCASATVPEVKEGKPSMAYFLAGLLYAIIPCTPLVTCLTYASTMHFVPAVVLLGLFGVVNSVVPVFLFSSIVGLANKEFSKNSAAFLKYIRLSGGLILIYASIFVVY